VAKAPSVRSISERPSASLRPAPAGRKSLSSDQDLERRFGRYCSRPRQHPSLDPSRAPMTLRNAAAARVRLVCSVRQPAGRYGGEQGQVARVKCARCPLLPPRIMSRQTVHCSSLVVAPTEGGSSGPQCPSKALSSTPVAREWGKEVSGAAVGLVRSPLYGLPGGRRSATGGSDGVRTSGRREGLCGNWLRGQVKTPPQISGRF
jgi:hypothetical protein